MPPPQSPPARTPAEREDEREKEGEEGEREREEESEVWRPTGEGHRPASACAGEVGRDLTVLDRELRGGWGSCAMHGRLHPASISTRAAATPGGARAAVVVHGAIVGRRSVGRRDGRLRPAFALPSIHARNQSPRPRLHPLSLSRTFSPRSSHTRARGRIFGIVWRNLHSLCSISGQSCYSSSSRSPARGRGDPGHGQSPFRSMSIRNSTRK